MKCHSLPEGTLEEARVKEQFCDRVRQGLSFKAFWFQRQQTSQKVPKQAGDQRAHNCC